MWVYRTKPARPDEIVLHVNQGSFFGRVRAIARQRWTTLAIFGLGPLAFPLGFALLVLAAGDGLDWALAIFKWGSVIVEAIFFAPVLLDVVWRAARPGDAEKLLPRQLVLREDGIEVTARDGKTSVERWTWLPFAREARGAFTLVLCESPLIEMRVPRSILSGAQAELLGKWLRANDCLRG